jgi:centromeric protein E
LRQEISNLLKAARSEDSFVSMQSSEPSRTSNDPKDQPNEVSNHSNVPSRTAEANESGLMSQVLMQVMDTCPDS